LAGEWVLLLILSQQPQILVVVHNVQCRCLRPCFGRRGGPKPDRRGGFQVDRPCRQKSSVVTAGLSAAAAVDVEQATVPGVSTLELWASSVKDAKHSTVIVRRDLVLEVSHPSNMCHRTRIKNVAFVFRHVVERKARTISMSACPLTQ
jgi:hypothetical protein